ncbi:4296_t:CDS:1, partial [Acaulospora colombiana]
MVLVKYFDSDKMKIDEMYYLGTVITTLGRMINYYDQFQIVEKDYETRDKLSQKKAEKYLRDYIKMINDRMNYDITRFISLSIKNVRKRKVEVKESRQTKIVKYFVP